MLTPSAEPSKLMQLSFSHLKKDHEPSSTQQFHQTSKAKAVPTSQTAPEHAIIDQQTTKLNAKSFSISLASC
jgi:hypothetical protein